jgi:uncharacterized protein YndB with AHSA1/START domain
MNIAPASGRVLVLERIFDAPPPVVFAMWTHPQHLIRWYGPRGHSLSVCEVDFRIGGKWRVCISRGEGRDENSWVWGTYHIIDEPRRLVFSNSMDWHRYETLVTLDFEDLGDNRTRLRLRQEEFTSVPDCDDHRWGWTGALDKLSEQLAVMVSAGLIDAAMPRAQRRSGVAEDYAEAARRAAEDRARVPEETVPPSVAAGRR